MHKVSFGSAKRNTNRMEENKVKIEFAIRMAMGMEPTAGQQAAIGRFLDFATDADDRSVMILRGSAGTGKTTLGSAIVKAMLTLRQRIALLAPTGRAAKVFSLHAGHQAYTIHRRIYRQNSLAAETASFGLNANMQQNTLFVVDEASMISNSGFADSMFGTGCLLDDLVAHVYGGAGCRLMLIGDKAQLPPVGEEESPALAADFMAGYGLRVYQADMGAVLRQAAGSGILYNATAIRAMITHDECTHLPKVTFGAFADIRMVPGGELIEQLASSYSRVGTDETMVVTRSNKRANIYNNGIRGMVLGREEELTQGDMLMVVRNNYYWTEREKPAADGTAPPLAFVANGDRAVVRRLRNMRELYGFRFADATMEFPDYDGYELTATVILDTLQADAPALTREQGERLFAAVAADYADIPRKAERIRRVREDRFYNAMQIKFAYAVTCHKAQGGQWAHVYVDQGYMTDDMLSADYIHWLYTAFTRATEMLYLVNWPEQQTNTTNQPI